MASSNEPDAFRVGELADSIDWWVALKILFSDEVDTYVDSRKEV